MQDDIRTNKFTYKTNAFCLLEFNNQLKDLCVKNEGKFVYVSSKDDLETHSKEGIQKLKL